MNQTIQSYRQKLNSSEFTREAACGRHYVFIERLQKWLNSPFESNPDVTHASVLLEAAYDDETFVPLTMEQISSPRNPANSCLLIFSLLLELGHGNLLHLFLRKNVVDRDLPTSSANFDAIKQLLENDVSNFSEIAARFEELRWRFCPVKFELGEGKDYVKERILPIHKRKVLSFKGGTADVWDIIIPEEFVSNELAEVVKESKLPDKTLGTNCYEFALKTFKAGSHKQFENERLSFQGLRYHSKMITYLGDFTHDFSYETGLRCAMSSGSSSSTGSQCLVSTVTYNILLEFGELDLEEYFLERLPPFLPSEILSFWEHFFEIPEGVSELHNLTITKNGTKRECHGWHADIKPDNILLVQDRFKLADPGFAVFENKTSTEDDPVAEIEGGTEAYGAPERDRLPEEPAYQTIDTWSLGCVFSKTATWIVLGHQGILQFDKLRLQAIQNIRQTASSILPRSDDAFHDGFDVLPVVKDWHKVLRSAARGTDHITSQILDVVDQKMLLGDPLKRVKTEELCELLRSILRQAGKENHDPIPDIIVNTLVQVDANAESKATEAMKVAAPNLQTRRSKLDNIPLMKTGNRSSLAPPGKSTNSSLPKLNVPSEDRYGKTLWESSARSEKEIHDGEDEDMFESPPVKSSSEKRPTTPDSKSTNTYSGVRPQSIAASYRQMDPGYVYMPPSPFMISPTQNVHQARFELEGRKRRPLLSFFRGRKTEENKLIGYFKNRDIKFLADNGPTMSQYWGEATNLIDTLMWKMEGLDDNGVDFYVTDNSLSVPNTKSKRVIKHAMVQVEPKERALGTDMNAALGRIFQEHYHEQVKNKNSGKTLRKMTLLVLTDGIFSGTTEEEAVDDQIVKFVELMTPIFGALEVRPCTIQFIQFGDDEHATQRLRRLDDDLKTLRNIPDVVDREHSSGDVNKMILGSIHAGMDSLNTASSTASTPSSHSEAGDRSPRLTSSSRTTTLFTSLPPQSGTSIAPFQSPLPRSGTVASDNTIRPTGGHRRNKPSVFDKLVDKFIR